MDYFPGMTPAAVIREWVSRLRSGKYKQVKSRLRLSNEEPGGHDGHCCLGVLCEISAEKGATTWAGDRVMSSDTQGVGFLTYPPGQLLTAAGVEDTVSMSLASMNDTGTSFAEIATRIERHADSTMPGWRTAP